MLEKVVVIAALFVMVIELARALPWPKSWTQRKPLSCDVCMSGWSGIAWALGQSLTPASIFEGVSAAGLCLLALIVFVTPRRGPPEWYS